MQSVIYLPNPETDESTTIIDGYVVSADGEILGLAEAPQGKTDFAVTDVESAEWVLRKMLEAQSAIEAIDQTSDVILARSILANAEKLKKPHIAKIAWLETCFRDGLEAVARQNLPKKGKTWQTLFGSISFRAVKAKLDIRATDRAAQWLATHFPACVRLTADLDQLPPNEREYLASLAEEGTAGVAAEIMKSKIPDDVLLKAMNTPDFEAETGIAFVPARESMTITVGTK